MIDDGLLYYTEINNIDQTEDRVFETALGEGGGVGDTG